MTTTYGAVEGTGSRTFRLAGTRAGSPLPPHDPQQTPTVLALARDGSVPRARLLWAVAALLEAIANDAPGDPDACAGTPEHDPGLAEPLTRSETRILRYLPTHLSAPEIAAELCVSAHTVKTHMKHLYRKLGVHSRHEAVRRARAIGLLASRS